MHFADREFPCKSCVQQEKETKSPEGGEGTPEEWLHGGQDRTGKDRTKPNDALTPQTSLQSLGPLTHPHPSISPAFIYLFTHLKPSAVQSRVLSPKKPAPDVPRLQMLQPPLHLPMGMDAWEWARLDGNGHGWKGMGTDGW